MEDLTKSNFWYESDVFELAALAGVLCIFGVATALVASYRGWDRLQARRKR